MGVNTWYHANSVSFKCHSIRVTFKICAVLGAQGIRATGFRRAQGNQHCAKFESHSNRVTFGTNAISITSSIHALCWYIIILKRLIIAFVMVSRRMVNKLNMMCNNVQYNIYFRCFMRIENVVYDIFWP